MKTPRLPLVLALFLAGACSNGSTNSTGPTVPSQPVAITAANATQVAQGMPLALGFSEVDTTVGFETLTADGTGTFPCPEGGSITTGFQTDAAPTGVVSSGDVYAVTFNQCALDVDVEIRGQVVFDFVTISGDYTMDSMWQVQVDTNVNDLIIESGPTTVTFDGSWSQDKSFDSGDSSYSLAGFFSTSVDDGMELIAASLSGLTLTCDYDSVASESTYTVDGIFASTVLGGSITLTTLTPIVQADGAEYPYTGSMRATGTDGSRLTMTILDETMVQLDVDEDGDGVDDATVTVTWAEIDA